TIATKTELKEELKQIRSTGFSVDMEGNTEGLCGVGCVIRDATGKVVAAMSIGVPSHTFTAERKHQLGTLNKLGARLISYRLGYQDSQNSIHDTGQIRVWWERSQSVSSY
ncbi:unnamed protein product, partial [marine sediment metagenome]